MFFSKKKKKVEKKKGKKERKEKVSIREKMLGGKLHCVIIIEIVGRPMDYIKKAMHLVLKGLSKEKGVEIISKKIHKPKKIQTLFSMFTEVELVVGGLYRLVEVVFDYMPSSVEIIEPAYLKIETTEVNNLINDLATKLHKAEAVAKRFGIENEILKKQIEALKKKG